MEITILKHYTGNMAFFSSLRKCLQYVKKSGLYVIKDKKTYYVSFKKESFNEKKYDFIIFQAKVN